MKAIEQRCVDAYRDKKNLKLAAEVVGIPWQTVYVHLRNVGEPVTGDKARYGSDKDRLAALGERIFQEAVPDAVDSNDNRWQAKVDFHVGLTKVDVKTSSMLRGGWAFNLKKQKLVADFWVCLAMQDGACRHALLIPGEIAKNYQCIRIYDGRSNKWNQYEVALADLAPFFSSIAKDRAA